MSDFGKALRQLERKDRSSAVAPAFGGSLLSLAEQLQFFKRRIASTPATLPSGTVYSNALGSHYRTHTIYAGDYYHGKVGLSRFSSNELGFLMQLTLAKGRVPQRDRIVFLDTETTGMQGGTGMCPFLIGIGHFSGDEFQMTQYFIRDFDEEPSMLLDLTERLRQFEMVVTYNGTAFDIPLLETRLTLARLDSPFPAMSHFDLLFTARKLWRNGHGSCRLVALERELISFLRGPDIPGAMIPRVYFDYLQRRPVPALESIFKHNLHDVVSLAALTVHACDRVVFEPAALDEPLDLYSLARILDGSADWRRSIRLYEMALEGGLPEPMRIKALENLAVACRRAGEFERSLQFCEELTRCAQFSMTGYEGAAIYYERVAKDYDSALRTLEEGLARTESKRWRMLLQARWDRLQQRKLHFVTATS